MIHENWQGFNGGAWTESIDVRDFIQRNYTPYTGDESFLAGATERTKKLNDKYLALRQEELQKKFYEISERMYQAAAQQGQNGAPGAGFDPNAAAGFDSGNNGPTDADFTDVGGNN